MLMCVAKILSVVLLYHLRVLENLSSCFTEQDLFFVKKPLMSSLKQCNFDSVFPAGYSGLTTKFRSKLQVLSTAIIPGPVCVHVL